MLRGSVPRSMAGGGRLFKVIFDQNTFVLLKNNVLLAQ
jgi:hypothetical protein